MTLHNAEKAEKFATKSDCWDWINERIVRFKHKMVPAMDPEGKKTFVPQKCDGQIVNTSLEGYKSTATDEPLKSYAEPVKSGDEWMAIMKMG